jgi:SAM-dependent methyltransferase
VSLAVARTEMERFWDERAREDAYFFVDNRVAYRNADVERFWAGGEEALTTILDTLGVQINAEDVVVEVGCGVGRLTRALARRAREVHALDVSSEMLDRARELNPQLHNVRWIHGDGRTLAGISDATAQACVSHVVFQHIPDPEITLGYVREMGRVLAPQGWSAFQVSTDRRTHRRRITPRALLTAVLSRVGRAPRGMGDRAWRGSAIDLDDLRAAAADGGMTVDRVANEGSQFCLVLTRRVSSPARRGAPDTTRSSAAVPPRG